jgi:hypothetical protein
MHGDTPSTLVAFPANARRGASSSAIAQTTHEMWQQIDASLSPIIGHGGVAALYRCSAHLLAKDHPCLGTLELKATSVDVLAELQRASEAQTPEAAMEMNAAMLETLARLLTKLVGASLTERLLRPVSQPPVDS